MPQDKPLRGIAPKRSRPAAVRARVAAVALALVLVSPAAWAQSGSPARPEALPPLPLPRDQAVEQIAPYLRMNGSPMQISMMQVQDLAPIERFYKDYFSQRGERGVMSDVVFEGRRLLSGMVDKRLITVELLPERSGYTVLVSSMVPERVQAPEKLARGTPRMPGTDVLQVLESVEAAGGHVTTSMRNRYSVESNAYYLRAQMLLQGWHRVRDDTLDAGAHRQLGFAKPGRQMRVDLQRRDDATVIVFNETQ